MQKFSCICLLFFNIVTAGRIWIIFRAQIGNRLCVTPTHSLLLCNLGPQVWYTPIDIILILIYNKNSFPGVIKTLPENILDCGLRVLLEYVYYPNRSQLHRELAFEYCTEKDGACKLTVGWHLSNTSIENFEFLKTENNFKKFFIKNDHYLEPFI